MMKLSKSMKMEINTNNKKWGPKKESTELEDMYSKLMKIILIGSELVLMAMFMLRHQALIKNKKSLLKS